MNIRLIAYAFICALACISHLGAQKSWSPVSSEEAEFMCLMQNCNAIAEKFIAMGACCSSSYSGAIFGYLKNV